MSWIIVNGEPFQTEAPEVASEAIAKPYPLSYWLQSGSVNEGNPFCLLMPGFKIMPGAFQDVATLEKVSIPQSVKRIGENAFAGTALKKVRIARDCEYFPTSFPEDCVVEFYGGEVTT